MDRISICAGGSHAEIEGESKERKLLLFSFSYHFMLSSLFIFAVCISCNAGVIKFQLCFDCCTNIISLAAVHTRTVSVKFSITEIHGT